MSVKRFSELFAGLDRVHGKYDIDHDLSSRKEKVTGKAVTVKAAVTIELYAKHINGEQGLGIVPIRDDQSCMFGAIDIDDYDITLEELNSDIQEKNLPLVLCRTKSGGAHCYMFFTEPCRADIVRDALIKCANALGHPGVEIFPKQKKIRENDVGNWINLPYFDADAGETDRYALDKDGKPIMALDDFVEFAEAARIDLEQLRELDPPPLRMPFDDGPACIQRMLSAGAIGEGQRNNTLLQMGVYARYKYGQEWEEKVDELNFKYVDPPLPSGEVEGIKKSLSKKDYAYQCKISPFVDVCKREACLARPYGVGGGAAGDDNGAELEMMLGGLRKSVSYDLFGNEITDDEVIWFMDCNGYELQFSTAELLDQRKVIAKMAERAMKLPSPTNPRRWNAILKEKIETAETIEFPADTGTYGAIVSELKTFITEKQSTENREDVLDGKVYYEDGVVYWRQDFFWKHLIKAGVFRPAQDGKKLHVILRQLGAEQKQLNLNSQKNLVKQVWYLENFSKPTIPDSKKPKSNY